MKLRTRQPSTGSPGLVGSACVDRRIAGVLRRAGSGDVVVTDHLDLDRTYAEALLDRGVAAVINTSPFISGRYPNLGPELLAKAGVVLVDLVDEGIFNTLKDGRQLRIHDGVVYAGEDAVGSGR